MADDTTFPYAAFPLSASAEITDPEGTERIPALRADGGIGHFTPDGLKAGLENLAAVTSVAGRTGAITLAQADIAGLVAALAALAPLVSPPLAGTPTAPTPATGDNSTRIATTAFLAAIKTELQAQINGVLAPRVVADATARDALDDLFRLEVVHVEDDDGAGNWKRYQITDAGDGTWADATKVVIGDEANQPATHSHAIGDVTGLQTALDAKVPLTTGLRIQTSTLTLNVPSAYATVQDAIDEACKYIFTGTAYANIVVAAGTYTLATSLVVRHPQRGKIRIAAAANPSNVVYTDWSGTKATDEATLRSKYSSAVIFECAGNGIEVIGSGLLDLVGCLFVRTGSSGGYGLYAPRSATVEGLTRTIFHGFQVGIYAGPDSNVAVNGGASTTRSGASHCSSYGLQVVNGGTLTSTYGISAYCSATGGVYADTGGILSFNFFEVVGAIVRLASAAFASLANLAVRGAASYSLWVDGGARLIGSTISVLGNSNYAIYCKDQSLVTIAGLTLDGDTSTKVTLYADGMSTVRASSITSPNATVVRSPALNTVGNSNSISL